jgi:hypothetical protein
MCHDPCVKLFDWNVEKNEWLPQDNHPQPENDQALLEEQGNMKRK